MKSKTLLMAFMLSASMHGALILPIFPIISNFSIKDGSDHMSISMGSIVVGKEKAEKRGAVVKAQKAGSVSELSGQILSQYSAGDNVLGRSGEEENDKGKVRSQYFAEIRRRIEKAKKYPALARLQELEGIAQVEFIISKAGNVEKAGLARSSNYQILDNEAMATIKRASPFPPIPEGFGESRIKVVIHLVFELQGGGDTP